MLQLNHIHFAWPNSDTECLHDIHLSIAKGEAIALIGDNGAGKSTLLKLICGLLKPTAGSITIHNQDLAKLHAGERAKLVGLLFQEPERQFFHNSVKAEIAYGLKIQKYAASEIEAKVTAILQAFNLTHRQDDHPLDLNSAEKRMVTLASLAVLNLPVLLLDEPSRDLDDDWLLILEQWLKKSQANGTTIIAISHDPKFIEHNTQRIIRLSQGKISID